MAHENLHIKEAVVNQSGTKGKQMRVSLALIGTLAGGVLLLNSLILQLPFLYGKGSDISSLCAMVGAILLAGPVIWNALKGLLKGRMHMDELVALAIVAAFATGKYEVAGVIALFLLLSELIETRTALGARAAIESLIRLTPTQANLIGSDGSETEVQVSTLKAGDVIRVRPGDNIAADGEVINGTSTVNEATITGESLPVDKLLRNQVFAGTSNLTGALDIKVTKAGKDTTLGKVQSLIIQAEHSRIPIMRIIDQYIRWYMPMILMIAFIVWLWTKNLNSAISILIVSCPCALILATPTAMVAAISAAARLGILIKNVSHLELAGKITAIIFDKTGTLTTGKLFVTKLTPAKGVEASELLTFATSAEKMSKHPAAIALRDISKQANVSLVEPEDFVETPGKGVSANVNKAKIIVGRDTFLRENSVDISGIDDPALHEEEGFSTLYVAKDGKCIGWIGMQDKTRPEARNAVEQLTTEGGVKRVTMLTGDRSKVAQRVAGELGCTDVKANCLPQDKLSVVERIQKDGHTVAVVGDGINDAPALAAGDLGIAMGAAGSDVAINSASIALMNNDLKRLPFLITLSRKTRNVVSWNLGFGVLFIVLSICASAAGYVPPAIAAMLHFGSSLIVVFNSARLVRFGEHLVPHSVLVEDN